MSLSELFFGPSQSTIQKHPHLFQPRQSHASKTASRTVPMQVLSLGMSRTGTASMKAALEILGFPCAHGFDMHTNPEICDSYMQAFEAKYYQGSAKINSHAFWDGVLGDKAAVTDTPANAFGPELIAAYPDAKVVLVEREIEAWYTSFERALIAGTEHPWIVGALAWLDRGRTGKQVPVLFRGIMQGQFGAKDEKEFKAKARTVYRRHYEEIRKVLRKRGEEDRLLEYRLGAGWEPLCKFLGVKVPDVEFPRVNETEVHDEMLSVIYMMIVRRIVGRFLAYAAPFMMSYVAWKLWTMSS